MLAALGIVQCQNVLFPHEFRLPHSQIKVSEKRYGDLIFHKEHGTKKAASLLDKMMALFVLFITKCEGPT